MTSPTQSAMEQQQREAFEAWGLREGRLPAGHKRSPGGRYFYMEVQEDWECWQAAVASQASELRSLRDSLALARSHIGELREALTEAERRLLGAWQMLEAICDNDFSRDRRRAADKALDGLNAVRAALNKEQP